MIELSRAQELENNSATAFCAMEEGTMSTSMRASDVSSSLCGETSEELITHLEKYEAEIRERSAHLEMLTAGRVA